LFELEKVVWLIVVWLRLRYDC